MTDLEENPVSAPKPVQPTKLVDAPYRSIVWIAFWLLIGLVAAILVFAAGPHAVGSRASDPWNDQRGYSLLLILPLFALVFIVLLTVGAIRRAKPYREQRKSPEGLALQADMDAALGRKPYIGMYVIGIVLAVVFALIFVFFGLGFIVDPADVSLSVVVGILIVLLILGIPAAGLLSVALHRRASRRRLRLGE
jgi:Na+/melibiose symporter-like transporter